MSDMRSVEYKILDAITEQTEVLEKQTCLNRRELVWLTAWTTPKLTGLDSDSDRTDKADRCLKDFDERFPH